ncbi:16S rRNA processing protein RimM [Candidatus Symbiothrix dinenymphae]|nr:16S rRNA processing protein RimM [Candidatus Symbiothrix dinenymphae]
MIRREDLVKIGKFGKPHGVSGQLSVTSYQLPEVFENSERPFFVCEIDNIFVPFRVIESRIISDTAAYVQLKNLNSNEAVRILVNKDVYLDKRALVIGGLTRNPLTEHPNAVSWDYFLGYTLVDKHSGEIGVVSAVDDSTLNVLFVVKSHHAAPLLIPANADFIASVDEAQRVICLDLPEGLLGI